MNDSDKLFATEGRNAARRFQRQVEKYGFPDWGIRCKHGVQGGLHCSWCGEVSKLPKNQQLSGIPKAKS